MKTYRFNQMFARYSADEFAIYLGGLVFGRAGGDLSKNGKLQAELRRWLFNGIVAGKGFKEIPVELRAGAVWFALNYQFEA